MKQRFWEIFKLFIWLGITAFGGPLAHIAMMRHEFVQRHKWLSDEKFIHLIGLTNLIPGPNSTEMAIHLGYTRAGWRGSILSGVCFIIPAVVITLIIARSYKLYGEIPQVKALLYGIKPTIIVIILTAIYPLFKVTINSWEKRLWVLAILCTCFIGVNEIFMMFSVGALHVIGLYIARQKSDPRLLSMIPLAYSSPISSQIFTVENMNLFGIFFKIGAILYGSGYVLFAFLDSELVQTGYLTRAQLMDAIAVGQITPGPVFSAVTFVGYQLSGISGAIISTVAIFLPSFIFVIGAQWILPKMQKSEYFSAFLSGVNTASLAIILFALIDMSKTTFVHGAAVLIAIFACAVFFLFRKLNSAFVVLLGGAFGWILLELRLIII